MNPETALTLDILAEVGASQTHRLWRNATRKYWTGHYEGRTRQGHVILSGATMVSAGQCDGSSDLVGIHGSHGQFVGIELKTPTGTVKPHQRQWLEVVRSLGGLTGVARSVDDVRELLAGFENTLPFAMSCSTMPRFARWRSVKACPASRASIISTLSG